MCNILISVGDPDGVSLAEHGNVKGSNRGKSASGVTAFTGRRVRHHRRQGVPQVQNLKFRGKLVAGQTRYRTAGDNSIDATQPAVHGTVDEIIRANQFVSDVWYENDATVLVHNGNIHELEGGVKSPSDSYGFLELIVNNPGVTLMDRVHAVASNLNGAFSVGVMNKDGVVVARDSEGVRPLWYGLTENGYPIFTSEDGAMRAIGATPQWELDPGMVVSVGLDGEVEFRTLGVRPLGHCSVEYDYFARPDSTMNGIHVATHRRMAGASLAKNETADYDCVVPVPHTAILAAQSFALAAQKPYVEAIVVRDPSVRTFILPEQRQRERAAFEKFQFLDYVRGKKVLVIDDSVIRGTVGSTIVPGLFDAGATEVHYRVIMPSFLNICRKGIDIGSREELIMYNEGRMLSAEAMGRKLDATTVRFHSLDEYMALFPGNGKNFCYDCMKA